LASGPGLDQSTPSGIRLCPLMPLVARSCFSKVALVRFSGP